MLQAFLVVNAVLFLLGGRVQNSILPGQGIGDFRLNQTLEELTAKHGQPKAGDLSLGRGSAAWDVKYTLIDGRESVGTIKVFLRRVSGAKSYSAVQISTDSPSYRTRAGIRVSSTLGEITKAYLDLVRSEIEADGTHAILDSRDMGIAFLLNKESRCQKIVIHRPGTRLVASEIP